MSLPASSAVPTPQSRPSNPTIITVASQKGGVGKTTLTVNLAVAASEEGLKTLIIDLDPQRTATQWWESREGEAPQLVAIGYNEMEEALQLARSRGFDVVLIDTPGRDDNANSKAATYADFVVIPCQPTLPDIRGQKATVDLVQRLKKPAAFVLTRCDPVGHQRPDAARQGLAAFGVPIAPQIIVNRPAAYPDSYALNQGVTEMDPEGKAAAEIRGLWQWCQKQIRRHVL